VHTHHEEAVRRLVERFSADETVDAVLLVGSIAHGFETEASDVDVMLLVSEARYAELAERRTLTVYSPELCTYPGGYVDGKYIDSAFLHQVAQRGSEPARFAFQGARVLFSRNAAMEDLLRDVVRYPLEGAAERMRRFYAQLEAWTWYLGESAKRGDAYLRGLSIAKVVLFGGRLILAHNRVLYPYHKWFLRVLAGVEKKPAGLMTLIEHLYQTGDLESARRFYELIKDFADWGMVRSEWPTQFMKDSELNWQHDHTPVDDL